jgi:S1-C subfamily serine protease
LSIADVQWVLHQAGETAKLDVEVRRNGQTQPLTLTLAKGWRQQDDISWRATSWDLRRITLGGMRLESLPDAERQALKLPAGELALRAKWVGQYNEHAVAKRAGFLKDDIILAIDGDRTPITESRLMARFAQTKQPGDKVTMTVLRGPQRLELTFAQQ